MTRAEAQAARRDGRAAQSSSPAGHLDPCLAQLSEQIADLLEREGLNFGMRFEENGDGVRVSDFGTPPSRAAAKAPDDVPEE